MPETVEITRYPNRRLYDHRGKRYVNLGEIDAIIRQGDNVCIRDKKSGDDVTRMLLIQLLLERHPRARPALRLWMSLLEYYNTPYTMDDVRAWLAKTPTPPPPSFL